MKRSYGLVFLCVLGLSPAWTQAQTSSLPESVRRFEQVKDRVPDMTVNGIPLQGLSLCKRAQRCHEPQPFLALPRDVLPDQEPCDLSTIHLAYKGWCRAGIVHPTNPHLAPSQLPLVTCEEYAGQRWLFFNNVTKFHWRPTSEGEVAAVRWLTKLPPGLQPWSAGIELIPQQWLANLPPQAPTTPEEN